MKWIVAALTLALMLAIGALFFAWRGSVTGTAVSEDDCRYYKTSYERMSAKYAYLKRKNRFLSERLNRQKALFRDYREKLLTEARRFAAEGKKRLAQGSLPFVGTPVLALTLAEHQAFVCDRVAAMKVLERQMLGYGEAEEEDFGPFCDIDKQTRSAGILEQMAEGNRRYRALENNESAMAALWRANVSEILAALASASDREKERILGYYETMPRDLNLSPRVEEYLTDTLDYWRTVYGL